MTSYDLLVISTIVICIAISAMRGLVCEILSFSGWLIAIILARTFAQSMGESLFPNIQPTELSVVCGFVTMYIAARIGITLVRQLLDLVIKQAKLTSINRLLGGILGAIKGMLVVSLVVVVCSFSDLPDNKRWQKSLTLPFFEKLADISKPMLPELLAKQVHFATSDDETDDTEPQEETKPRKRKPLLQSDDESVSKANKTRSRKSHSSESE